jgi:hypothetical protein
MRTQQSDETNGAARQGLPESLDAEDYTPRRPTVSHKQRVKVLSSEDPYQRWAARMRHTGES